jgi:two-component sensor histidine kinase
LVAGAANGLLQEATREVRAAGRARIAAEEARTRPIVVAVGVGLAAGALVAGTSPWWAVHVFAEEHGLSVALLSVGLAGFCLHATLLGMLAGTDRWSQYGSLMVTDAVIRVIVATAAFAFGWGLAGFLWATVAGAMAWLLMLVVSANARAAAGSRTAGSVPDFLRGAAHSIAAAGASAILVMGFPVLLKATSGELGAAGGVVILAVTAISFGGVNEAIAYLLFGQFGDFTALIDIALNTGLFTTLSILLGILRFTRDDLRELEREMNDVFDDDYFAGRLDRERLRARQRELAHLIHGRLQNHILGAVLALTKNPQSSDPHDLLEEIERLQQELSSPDNISPRDTTKGIAEELASLATRWHGIIDVTMSPDLPKNMGSEEIRALVTVAEEAVTNAVRHGLASSAEITLHQETAHWVLAISDNGVGPRNGPPGLGTLTLTHIATNAWSLSANPSGIGSLLTAHIPAQPAP